MLIIILKPNKVSYNSLKMFQSIVLLNILRKLIEKVISKKMQVQAISLIFIYSNQVEGLKQRSLVDADFYLIHLIQVG